MFSMILGDFSYLSCSQSFSLVNLLIFQFFLLFLAKLLIWIIYIIIYNFIKNWKHVASDNHVSLLFSLLLFNFWAFFKTNVQFGVHSKTNIFFCHYYSLLKVSNSLYVFELFTKLLLLINYLIISKIAKTYYTLNISFYLQQFHYHQFFNHHEPPFLSS